MEAAVTDPAPVTDIKLETYAADDGSTHQQYAADAQNGVATAVVKEEHQPVAVKAEEHAMQLDTAVQPAADGQQPAAAAADAAGAAPPPPAEAAPAAEAERKRRHKWGPPAAGEFANEQQKPKKRRSRWESSTDIVVVSANAGQIIIPGQLPKEVTICGGLKVGSYVGGVQVASKCVMVCVCVC